MTSTFFVAVAARHKWQSLCEYPAGNLGDDVTLFAVEAVIRKRFTGIAATGFPFDADQLLSAHVIELPHEPWNVTVRAMIAAILDVRDH